MSGSSGDFGADFTVNTEGVAEAMQSAADAVKQGMEGMADATASASKSQTASLKELQATLSALIQLQTQLGEAAASHSNVGEQIAAVQQQIDAYQRLAAAQKEAAAAAKEATEAQNAKVTLDPNNTQQTIDLLNKTPTNASGIQDTIDAIQRLDATMSSASKSAQTFASAMATQGVSATEAAMEEAAAAAQAAAAMENLGSKVTTLSGGGLQQLINQMTGAGQTMRDASYSAQVFSSSWDQVSAKLQVSSAAFARMQNDLGMENQRLLSAATAASRLGTATGDLGARTDTVSKEVLEFRQNLDAYVQSLGRVGEANGAAARAASTFRSVLEGTASAERMASQEAQDLVANNQKIDESQKRNTASAKESSAGVAGITHELMVLGHEAMTGNFSRIPGSMMVLANRVGTVSMAVAGLTGALLAAASAAVALVGHLNEVRDARIAAAAASAFAGNQGALPQDTTTKLADEMHQLPGVAQTEASKVVGILSSVTGANEQMVRAMMLSVPGLMRGTGESAENAAKQIASAFDSPISAGKAFLEQLHANSDVMKQFDAAMSNDSPIEQRRALMNALSAAVGRVNAVTQTSTNATRTWGETFAGLAGSAGAEMGGLAQGDTDLGKQAIENRLLRERQQLTDAVAAAQANMTAATRDSTQAGSAFIASHRQGLEEAQLSAEADAHSTQEANLRKSQAAVTYWETVRSHAEQGSEQERLANMQVLQSRLSLNSAQLASDNQAYNQWQQHNQQQLAEVKNAAAMRATSSQQLHNLELQAEVTYWQGALRATQSGTREQAEARRQLLNAESQLQSSRLTMAAAGARAGAKAEREAVAEQVAELKAKQQAEKENQTASMQIEDQILAVLKQHYGEDSRQYQEELRRKLALQQQYAAQTVASEMQHITSTIQTQSKATQEYQAQLQNQVSLNLMSNQQMYQALLERTQENAKADLAELDHFIASLQAGTEAYRKAMDERAKLSQQFSAVEASYQAKITQANQKAAQTQENSYIRAFESIGSSFSSSISSMIMKQTTWQAAFQKIAQTAISSFMGLITDMFSQWAAKWIAQTALQNTLLTQQVVAQQAAGASGFGAIIRWALQSLGVISATDVQTKAQQGITAAAQVQSNAAVAFSGAYAATAAIPYVGPALAPEAAGTAYAAVMAMLPQASLAVGAWNLDNDMVAQLHQGEMVVPKTYAEGMRSAASGGGGSTGNTTMSYSPTVNIGGGGGGGQMTISDMNRAMKQSETRMMNYHRNVARKGATSLAGA